MSRRSLSSRTAAAAVIAVSVLLLAACSTLPGQPASGQAMSQSSSRGQQSGPVALLVPLSGKLAPVGQSLEKSVKLAFSAQGTPKLQVYDTGGTPSGAASAAQRAVAAGAGIIIGPLTSADTKAVAPIASQANLNVLAFTNDDKVSGPGVWALGITPGQQVQRVASYAASQGKSKFAAILPDNAFGTLMAAALRKQANRLGDAPPQIGRYEDSFASLTQTVHQISAFDSRGAAIQAKIRAARNEDTAAGRKLARKLEHQPVPPPPFNALLLAATGERLAEVATLLPYYEAGPPQVLLMGPTLWHRHVKAMATHDTLRGAIYAAPDPSPRLPFVQKFQSTYGGSAPPSIDDVGFDAAAVAVLASREGGYTTKVLTNSQGFTGTDGVFRLEPDGSVTRGLAVFKVERGGPKMVSPPPHNLPAEAPPVS